MSRILHTNPGVLIWLVLFGIGAAVLMSIGLMASRSGQSLRPIYWFAGLLLLIGVPQFLAHLYIAIAGLKDSGPREAALQTVLTVQDRETRRESARFLFGPDADPDLIVDLRSRFGEAMAKANVAAFASLPGGETVLLARFNSYSAAEKGWVEYLRHSGLSGLKGAGDSQRGYVVTRPSGDRAYALHMLDMLGVWTGPDDAAIRRRMAAGGFITPKRAPLAALPEGVEAEPQPGSAKVTSKSPSTIAGGRALRQPSLFGSVPVVTASIAVFVFVVVLYFFKGAAWAGSVPPRPNASPAPAADLGARLESLNALDIPFKIERGERDHTWVATWRFADAKWIDLARARGLRRVHKIHMTLDPTRHTVRTTDLSTSFDWSAGRGGANLNWKSEVGIIFMQIEHQRVFGLQLDEHGRFKPELSYTYRFNLTEMKAPLIQAVTSAGWTWRPVVWQGPKWLRWLTE